MFKLAIFTNSQHTIPLLCHCITSMYLSYFKFYKKLLKVSGYLLTCSTCAFQGNMQFCMVSNVYVNILFTTSCPGGPVKEDMHDHINYSIRHNLTIRWLIFLLLQMTHRKMTQRP